MTAASSPRFHLIVLLTGNMHLTCRAATDLKVPSSLEPVMKGVDRVVYAPGAHFWEDPSNNRRIYDEAVGILANLGKDTTKRFLYVSSGGICTDNPPVDYLYDVFK